MRTTSFEERGITIKADSVPIDWSKIRTPLEKVKQDFSFYFPHLEEYWETHAVPYEDEQKALPPVYHGTRLSSLTGICARGLEPILEEQSGSTKAIYGTLNPHSAGYHILYQSNYDSYKDKPSQVNINQSDPPVILKVNMQAYIHYLDEKNGLPVMPKSFPDKKN